MRQVTLAPEVDLTRIAASTPGFVGADLANLVNEAALRAAREGKDAVEMIDFDAAIDRVVAGLERKSRVINPHEKEIVAYHEAGHALVAELRPHADRVAKISIIPRGVAALGYTQQQPTDDRYLMTRTNCWSAWMSSWAGARRRKSFSGRCRPVRRMTCSGPLTSPAT